VLHFLFPAAGFSGEGNAVDPSSVGVIKPVEPKGDDEGTEIGFMTLERAAMSVETRSHYEGRTYSLRGMFLGNDERFFTLTRYKMSCCPADAQALNAVIMLDEKSKERLPYNQLRKRWVEVTGRVQFITLKGTNGFMPALVLYPSPEKPLSQLVKEIPPDPNPYAN